MPNLVLVFMDNEMLHVFHQSRALWDGDLQTWTSGSPELIIMEYSTIAQMTLVVVAATVKFAHV